MKKRLLSLLLVLSVLFAAAAPVTAGAADTAEEPAAASGGRSNPLYGEVYVPELPAAAEAQSSAVKAATYVSLETAAKQLRDAMVNRADSVTLYVTYSGGWYTNTGNWVDEVLFPMAVSQDLAVGYTDGDYLNWSWRDYSWQGNGASGRYDLTVYLRYYTTYQEEQAFLSGLTQVMSSLGLSGLTDYGKYTAIYDYVTSHVTYDYAGLSTYEQMVGATGRENLDRSYFKPFTAYAALMNGTSVCQGYANLFYAMCRMADLPVRVVTGSSHAWNIAYLNGTWYSVDATWDSDYDGIETWQWYLLGSESFDVGGHTREAPFDREPFLSEYPVNTRDYTPATPYWDVRDDNYHAENITRATELGLLNGMGNHRFGPLVSMQRGMLVTVLWRMEGSPSTGTNSGFPDVSSGSYYAEAVTWAVQNGIVTGHEDGTFQPETDVTREQMVAILYRYAQKKGYQTSAFDMLSGYSDQNAVQSYARSTMQWAVGAGIIKGVTTTTLAPADSTIKEQLATILIRFIDYYNL